MARKELSEEQKERNRAKERARYYRNKEEAIKNRTVFSTKTPTDPKVLGLVYYTTEED